MQHYDLSSDYSLVRGEETGAQQSSGSGPALRCQYLSELNWGWCCLAHHHHHMFFPFGHWHPEWGERGKGEGEAPAYKQFTMPSIISAQDYHPGHLAFKEFIKHFYWSIVDVQCYVNFCCTAEWYSYPLFFRLFSHIGHYRVLSRVPCTTQKVLFNYLFYIL